MQKAGGVCAREREREPSSICLYRMDVPYRVNIMIEKSERGLNSGWVGGKSNRICCSFIPIGKDVII